MTKVSQANYQDLLRAIAVICMIIDHLGWIGFYHDPLLRMIGRSVMPVFCFFAGYNFTKPKVNILILGICLQVLEMIHFTTMMNMLFSIYFGQCVLHFIRQYEMNDEKGTFIICLSLIAATPFTYEIFEYGTLVIAFMLIGQLYRSGVSDPGYMPLLTLSTIMLADYVHAFSFKDSIMMAAMVCVTCYALSIRKYDKPISIDLRLISRNSLVIYFVNVALFIMIRFDLPLLIPTIFQINVETIIK